MTRAKAVKESIAALHEMKQFGIQTFLVLTHEHASQKLEWISKSIGSRNSFCLNSLLLLILRL